MLRRFLGLWVAEHVDEDVDEQGAAGCGSGPRAWSLPLPNLKTEGERFVGAEGDIAGSGAVTDSRFDRVGGSQMRLDWFSVFPRDVHSDAAAGTQAFNRTVRPC